MYADYAMALQPEDMHIGNLVPAGTVNLTLLLALSGVSVGSGPRNFNSLKPSGNS
jgi:hypothetical protein